MTAVDQVQTELQKAASMVSAARRLLATGTMVDLSALEGKVRFVCEALAGMGREAGRPMVPAIEALIADLDRLADAMRDLHGPDPADQAGTS